MKSCFGRNNEGKNNEIEKEHRLPEMEDDKKSAKRYHTRFEKDNRDKYKADLRDDLTKSLAADLNTPIAKAWWYTRDWVKEYSNVASQQLLGDKEGSNLKDQTEFELMDAIRKLKEIKTKFNRYKRLRLLLKNKAEFDSYPPETRIDLLKKFMGGYNHEILYRMKENAIDIDEGKEMLENINSLCVKNKACLDKWKNNAKKSNLETLNQNIELFRQKTVEQLEYLEAQSEQESAAMKRIKELRKTYGLSDVRNRLERHEQQLKALLTKTSKFPVLRLPDISEIKAGQQRNLEEMKDIVNKIPEIENKYSDFIEDPNKFLLVIDYVKGKIQEIDKKANEIQNNGELAIKDLHSQKVMYFEFLHRAVKHIRYEEAKNIIKDRCLQTFINEWIPNFNQGYAKSLKDVNNLDKLPVIIDSIKKNCNDKIAEIDKEIKQIQQDGELNNDLEARNLDEKKKHYQKDLDNTIEHEKYLSRIIQIQYGSWVENEKKLRIDIHNELKDIITMNNEIDNVTIKYRNNSYYRFYGCKMVSARNKDKRQFLREFRDLIENDINKSKNMKLRVETWIMMANNAKNSMSREIKQAHEFLKYAAENLGEMQHPQLLWEQMLPYTSQEALLLTTKDAMCLPTSVTMVVNDKKRASGKSEMAAKEIVEKVVSIGDRGDVNQNEIPHILVDCEHPILYKDPQLMSPDNLYKELSKGNPCFVSGMRRPDKPKSDTHIVVADSASRQRPKSIHERIQLLDLSSEQAIMNIATPLPTSETRGVKVYNLRDPAFWTPYSLDEYNLVEVWEVVNGEGWVVVPDN